MLKQLLGQFCKRNSNDNDPRISWAIDLRPLCTVALVEGHVPGDAWDIRRWGLWIGDWGVEVERENLTKSKQTENQSFTYHRPIATHFVAAFLLERILEFAAFCLSTMCNNIKERKTQPQLNGK